MLPMRFVSNPRRVKVLVTLCDQTATHPSQKAAKDGTLCVVVLAESWATRPSQTSNRKSSTTEMTCMSGPRCARLPGDGPRWRVAPISRKHNDVALNVD